MSSYHRHMGWAPYQTGFPSDHDPYSENWRRTQVARGIACTITFTREEEGGRVGRLPDLSSGQDLPHVLLTTGAAEPLGVAFVAGPRGPKAGTPVAAGAQFLYPDTVDCSVLLPGATLGDSRVKGRETSRFSAPTCLCRARSGTKGVPGRSFLTALLLGSLGLAGCATRRIASPISSEVSISLVDYLRALNETEPSDPVVDGRDPSVKARRTPPIERHRVQPELSRETRRNSREGRVVLSCVIERNGSVSDVRVISASGHGDFTAASVGAVRQWRYSPATIDGSAVRLFLTVTTSYRTHEEVPRRP